MRFELRIEGHARCVQLICVNIHINAYIRTDMFRRAGTSKLAKVQFETTPSAELKRRTFRVEGLNGSPLGLRAWAEGSGSGCVFQGLKF